ncbi:MAG: hypothetical protein GY866_26500 [Proteobacteria bacterium]|nr:hypothetical protein [Pseudomonadota bacterium]
MNYEDIDVNKIEPNDRLYYLPHTDASQVQWDAESTLFNPVWLQKTEPDRFRIVDGFVVVRLAMEKKRGQTIPARIFSEDTNPVALWKLRVEKRFREKNLVAIGFLEGLTKLLEQRDVPGIPDEIHGLSARMGISKKEIGLEQLVGICNRSKIFADFTELNQLGYKEIIQLSDLKEDKLRLLNRLFEGLRLKGNKLSTMLQLIDDLKRGFGVTLPDILKDEEIKTILEKQPNHLRYKFLKQRLTRLRFPRLNALRQKWNQTIETMDLPPKIEIRHDPFFEADELQFVLNVSSLKELNRQIRQIEKRSDSSEFGRLFDFV